ncbi:MAG: hypothetical protein GX443_15610 [Deltaproteobacteria bacterium]|nr:hypothetical protein [Deltaproteobacteria bacterium]
MKCHACGFIGFDHLSQCSKCGTDLSAVRDKLGFTAAKPSVPCFLAALLSNLDQGTPLNTGKPQRLEPAVSEIPEIEFGDEIEIAGEHPVAESVSTAASEPVAELQVFDQAGLHSEEGLTIDLSDEELNQLVGKQPAEPELELDLDFLLEDGSAALSDGIPSAAHPRNGNGKTASETLSLNMTELDTADLELTDEDLAQLEPEAGLSMEGEPLELSALPGEAGGAVMDLSDDDLHSLIADLDGTGGK